jgi:hypothetical protein
MLISFNFSSCEIEERVGHLRSSELRVVADFKGVPASSNQH